MIAAFEVIFAEKRERQRVVGNFSLDQSTDVGCQSTEKDGVDDDGEISRVGDDAESKNGMEHN